MPFASIAPQYTPPTPLTTLPNTAHQVYARYGDVALIGYETPDQRYAPGETVPITVYWQVVEQSSRDLSLFLNAVVSDGAVIGKVDSYPGAGRLLTTTWQTGAIYADTYGIPLDMDAEGRSTLRVQVGWWHYPSEDVIGPTGEEGQPLNSVFLDAGAFVGGQERAAVDSLIETEYVEFGGLVRLIGYRLDGDVLTLGWEALGTPASDYTVFVQVVDGGIVGQGDAPPELPTRYWRAGERYVTTHTIAYPETPAPGTYRSLIGWYRPDTFERLAAAYLDNAYPLMSITVE